MATNSSSKTTSNKQTQSTERLMTILLSGLIGFFGGFVALRFSPDLVPSTTTSQQIVVKEGELLADIVERVAPSVVSIDVTAYTTTYSPFFGSQNRESQAAGTGIILSKDGLVVTNRHVIPDSATEVNVILNDGTVYDDVEIIGRETFNDLAYLKIKKVSNLTPAVLGDSDEVRVGEQVIAIGNALGEFDTTVTSGIISGEGRPIVAGVGQDSEQLSNLFQTDAAINQGNSGGPLMNINGEVIGINTAVAGGAENIGFAIPINDVKPGIQSVEDNGELIKPYLGVRYIMLNEEIAKEVDAALNEGAMIFAENDEDAIIAGSPADEAGLKNKDIIISVNDTKIDEENPLPNVVSRFQVGETINLEINRDGKTQNIGVTLQQVPEDL